MSSLGLIKSPGFQNQGFFHYNKPRIGCIGVENMRSLWLLFFLIIPVYMISQMPSIPGFPTIPGIPTIPGQIPQQFPQQLPQQQLPQQLPQQGPLPQPQVGLPGPLNLPAISGNFKPPDWLKRGLVVYYRISGSSKLGNRASAFSGINVFIVWEVSNNKIVGDWISLLSDSMLVQSGLKELSRSSDSIFHVNPNYAEALLRSTGNLRSSGVTIQGGPGNIYIKMTGQKGYQNIYIKYDLKTGIILSLQQVTPDSSIFMEYAGYEYVNLPPPSNTFPPAVQGGTHNWVLSTSYMGMEMQFGELTISQGCVQGRIAHFRGKYDLYTTQGVQNQQFIGVPDIGPHYVNPSLLNDDVIFDLKQMGLRLVVVGRDYNDVTLELQYRMMPLIRSVVDPRTGLITYMEQFVSNMGSIKSYLEM